MAALPAAPFAYPIVDASRLRGRDPAFVVDSLARAGARLIQLRAKGLSDRPWLAMARAALAAARASGAPLVVNDRADIARIVGADGLHVGQDDLTGTDARAVVGPGVLLGLSTHNLDQLAAAATEAVDYVAIGGITRANARSVVEAGADGLAVISDLLDAPDLARAFTELAAAIRG